MEVSGKSVVPRVRKPVFWLSLWHELVLKHCRPDLVFLGPRFSLYREWAAFGGFQASFPSAPRLYENDLQRACIVAYITQDWRHSFCEQSSPVTPLLLISPGAINHCFLVYLPFLMPHDITSERISFWHSLYPLMCDMSLWLVKKILKAATSIILEF